MAFLKIPNVSIKGIAACVPPYVEENRNIPFYTPEEAEKIIESTGVERKHKVVDSGITALDLCFKASQILLNELHWSPETIDALCYVTQTPDYINQPTGFVLHDKLKLTQDCMVVDLFHGCPGWVVGLSAISSFVSHGSLKRVLFAVGDNITSQQYPQDREARPLFGDAGSVTALEFDEEAPLLYFNMGTNSKDGETLIRKRGAYRQPHTIETYKTELSLLSGELSTEGLDDNMDGMSVFSFGITTPPKSIKQLCEQFGIELSTVDKLVLHQANKFMINKIAKKLKVDMEKVPTCLKDYGNTTNSSIPLTIVTQCSNEYKTKKLKTIACGFGTGLSWGTVCFETDSIVCPDIITYDKDV
jgi:3-oxoacyl-[acyl-carrier-protein] synthase-3